MWGVQLNGRSNGSRCCQQVEALQCKPHWWFVFQRIHCCNPSDPASTQLHGEQRSLSSGASAAEHLQPGEGSRNTVVVWQEPASVNTATTLECETTLSYVGRLDLQSLAILENRMLRTGKIKKCTWKAKMPQAPLKTGHSLTGLPLAIAPYWKHERAFLSFIALYNTLHWESVAGKYGL